MVGLAVLSSGLLSCYVPTRALTVNVLRPYVTTYAGIRTGANGYLVDGPALTTAEFSSSTDGIAVDGSGNVYVADTDFAAVRKITPDGYVFTLSAGFGSPTGVASTAGGLVYVADQTSVYQVTPAGTKSPFASGFTNANSLAVDSDGNVYVCDGGANMVYKLSPLGAVVSSTPSIGGPTGVAVDKSGNVFVASSNNQVWKGTSLSTMSLFAGSGSPGSADGLGTTASFQNPWGLALDNDGNLYVGDTDNHTIRKITPDGLVTTLAGKAGTLGSADGWGSAATFCNTYGVCVDASGTIFVADNSISLIRKIVLKHPL